MLSKISWYINRLQCMSSGEIAYRLLGMIRTQMQKRGFIKVNHKVECITDRNVSWLVGTKKAQSEEYHIVADNIMSGKFSIFALDDPGLGGCPQWNRDPDSKIESPLVFGKTINYRDFSKVGDIKYVWELNRHLQLVTVGQAYFLSGQAHYLEGLHKQLISWFKECPYMLGPNWSSSLELGIRLINWAIVWQLVGGTEGPLFKIKEGQQLRELWLKSIYQHCDFIDGHWSRFSSANNHLIGEAAGLFIASVTWPYWDKSSAWKKKSYRILLEEIFKQNTSDGVNKEQAISYQQFVLDFFILSGIVGKNSFHEFPPEYWARIEKMLEFIASLMDVRGNIPMIGDADDGYVVKLSQEKEFCPYKSLLATGAVIFGRPDFKEKAGRFDDKSRWLLGEDGEKKFGDINKNSICLPVQQSFHEGGYYILGCDFETNSEIRLVVDCGPLGYLSIAAHGHADALAFTLSTGGKEFLIDPGTYAYHTKKKWRDYFRGTSAHNTVRVDGVDQSVSGGNFMWIRHAKAHCKDWKIDDKRDVFSGWHNGYQRLDDPVTHARKIELDKLSREIHIFDKINGNKNHIVEWFWHFSEKCNVNTENNGNIMAENDGKVIEIKPDKNVAVTTYYGSESPPAGWVSRSYDVKTPTITVAWRAEISSEFTLNTLITCS